MLEPPSPNTCILRNEVLSGYFTVSKRIEVRIFYLLVYHKLEIPSELGDGSSLFRERAYRGSLTGYPAHEIFVSDECSSLTTLERG